MMAGQQLNDLILSSYLLLPFNLSSVDLLNPYIWYRFDIRELKESIKFDVKLAILENPQTIMRLSLSDRPFIEDELVKLLSDGKLFAGYFNDPCLSERIKLINQDLQRFDIASGLMEIFKVVAEVVVKAKNRATRPVNPKAIEYIRTIDIRSLAFMDDMNVEFIGMLQRLLTDDISQQV